MQCNSFTVKENSTQYCKSCSGKFYSNNFVITKNVAMKIVSQ